MNGPFCQGSRKTVVRWDLHADLTGLRLGLELDASAFR